MEEQNGIDLKEMTITKNAVCISGKEGGTSAAIDYYKDNFSDSQNAVCISGKEGGTSAAIEYCKDNFSDSQSEGTDHYLETETESTFTTYSQGTDFTMTQSSGFMPSSQEEDARQQHLDRFLESCNIDKVGAPRRSWADYTKKTRKKYLLQFKECLLAVVDCFFPSNKDIMDDFFSEFCTKSHVQQNDVNSDNSMVSSLVESYQKAETWQLKRQILSVISISKSFPQVAEVLPDTTEYRYYIAKKHAIMQGCALPPPTKEDVRQKMDPVKLDSFLDYITSSHIIKDLPYGQRKLKTSDGKVIETPNIIRSMAPQAIIDQYKQYCEEMDIQPLGTSTMFRILQNCTATIRKSLEGLDYFLAEGGRSIDDLADIISSLDLSVDDAKRYRDLLLGAKRYLKTDYKVHVAEKSSVADHCRSFALSDQSKEFQEVCYHPHEEICQSCQQIQDILETVKSAFQSTDFTNRDDEDDINFRILQAEKGINNWKMHSLRAKNQDVAKREIFESMSDSEMFIVFDWAMKYLPRKFREDSLDWFAKRGVSWHISVVFRKRDGALESLPHIHIFEGQVLQDASITVAAILDVISSLAVAHPTLQKIHLWSDNAGCYKSSETLSTLYHNAPLVKSYNFCEAQDGKGACDRVAATIKSGIRRYVNQGHNVVTAQQMKTAVEKMKSNVEYKVKLVEVGNVTREKYTTIPNISTMSNFRFTENGLLVWKNHSIGQVRMINKEKLDKKVPTTITTISDWNMDASFHKLCGRKINSAPDNNMCTMFTCVNPGCVESFPSATELEDHLIIGECNLQLLKEKTKDKIKYVYVDKLQVAGLGNDITMSCGDVSSGNSELQRGWAIKQDRKTVRFNDNQKDYLIEKFQKGTRTGRKEDPVFVSEDMRKVLSEEGRRRFSFDELLTPQQIASFFSRVCRKNKMEEKDTISIHRDELIASLHTQLTE